MRAIIILEKSYYTLRFQLISLKIRRGNGRVLGFNYIH